MWTIIESSADKNAHLPEFDEPVVRGADADAAHGPQAPALSLWLRILRSVVLLAVAAFLCITLIAQWLYVNRAALESSPTWRGYWEKLCVFADCDVPPAQDVTALRSVFLEVDVYPDNSPDKRPDTGLENGLQNGLQSNETLQVRFRIQNTSRVPQKFPAVELSFTNTANDIVASRRFYPGHYLNREGFLMQHIRPAAEIDGLLTIINPGDDAVNYAIKFVYE